MANDRQWDWNEICRFQLTGEYPGWYEKEPVQTEAKAKTKTEKTTKFVDVQPTD